MIARSYPLYQQSPIGLHIVAFIGAVGTVFAAGMGLANNDIKRVLAYSTMSQIAYMFVGVGVAVYSAGMFHLLEHAFFKALLFMGAGAVMHAMHDELDIQTMGGLRRQTAVHLLARSSSASLPSSARRCFSGFFSKEDVIGAAYARALHGDSCALDRLGADRHHRGSDGRSTCSGCFSWCFTASRAIASSTITPTIRGTRHEGSDGDPGRALDRRRLHRHSRASTTSWRPGCRRSSTVSRSTARPRSRSRSTGNR